MKRTLLRLAALTAVVSLGTFAVVEAQRSNRTAQAEAAAGTTTEDGVSNEPAPFVVDERTVKPMPQPTVLETAADQPPADDGGTSQAGGTAAQTGAADPFSGARWDSHYPPDASAPVDGGAPLVPEAEDPQGIPAAPEAMRRYDAQQAAGRGGRGNIRPLTYDEGTTAAQSPDDGGRRSSRAAQRTDIGAATRRARLCSCGKRCAHRSSARGFVRRSAARRAGRFYTGRTRSGTATRGGRSIRPSGGSCCHGRWGCRSSDA